MPVFDLKLKAELENVESISATDDTVWRIKIECKNCNEVSPAFIEVSSTEEVEVPGTRGTCNCCYSCKSYPVCYGQLNCRCRRKIQIDVVKKSLTPYTTSEKSAKIVSFEVRGGEPCEFQPAVRFWLIAHLQDGFNITAESGAKFEDVDLQEDFADYDGMYCFSFLMIRGCWRSCKCNEHGVVYRKCLGLFV